MDFTEGKLIFVRKEDLFQLRKTNRVMGSRLAKVANQYRIGIRYVAKGIPYKDVGNRYGTKTELLQSREPNSDMGGKLIYRKMWDNPYRCEK